MADTSYDEEQTFEAWNDCEKRYSEAQDELKRLRDEIERLLKELAWCQENWPG